jgi:hypothetical protein
MKMTLRLRNRKEAVGQKALGVFGRRSEGLCPRKGTEKRNSN